MIAADTIHLEDSQLWAGDHVLAGRLWGRGWRPRPARLLEAGEQVITWGLLFAPSSDDLLPARVFCAPERCCPGLLWVATTLGVIEAEDDQEVWIR